MVFHLPVKRKKSSIFWEHFLLSAVGMVCTFAIIIFSPIAFSGKRGSGPSPLAEMMITLIDKHPGISFLIASAVILVINSRIFLRNMKCFHVYQFEYDEQAKIYRLGLTNLYFGKFEVKEIPEELFSFRLDIKFSTFTGKSQRILFYESQKNVGEINPAKSVWLENIVKIKLLLQYLKALENN